MRNSKNFYQRFLPLFTVITCCTIPFAIVGGIIDLNFILWKIILRLLIVLTFNVAGTYMLIKMPITISADGLNCIDWMFNYRFTSWNNIRFVKLTKVFFGLPYFRIGLNDSKDVIWLPLFLKDFSEFVKLVIKYAGNENILSKELIKKINT